MYIPISLCIIFNMIYLSYWIWYIYHIVWYIYHIVVDSKKVRCHDTHMILTTTQSNLCLEMPALLFAQLLRIYWLFVHIIPLRSFHLAFSRKAITEYLQLQKRSRFASDKKAPSNEQNQRLILENHTTFYICWILPCSSKVMPITVKGNHFNK